MKEISKKFREAVDLHEYLPRGIIAPIARDAGCSRQFAHMIVRGGRPEGHWSETSLYFMQKFTEAVNARRAEAVRNRDIVQGLKHGKSIKLTAPRGVMLFVQNLLAKEGVDFSMESKKGARYATYTFTPL